MIPIRNTLERTVTPVVNRSLVIANIAVFVGQLFLGERAEWLIQAFGFIPARLTDPGRFHYTLLEASVTLGTSLFLHGGLIHLVGNMVYLHVFGSSVEQSFGHARYLIFYLAGGAIGSLTHTVVFPHSLVPSIGASGSIAAVLGAFLVLHPGAPIVTLFPLIIYWAMAEVRAAYLLPVWFGMQFLNGFLTLHAARGTQEVAGIAWWAHIGGFVFGCLVAIAGRAKLRVKGEE